VGDVMATVGGAVSIETPLPVTIREMVSPFAVTLTFALTVADVLGVKRTVTAWVAPSPARVKGLPETTLKGAEAATAPETVPPTAFCTVTVCSAKLPRFTLPKSTVPVGLTANSLRATSLATGVEQALSLPLASIAVTET